MTLLLIAQSATERDGVNLFPLVLVTLLLLGGAAVVYFRRTRGPH